MRCEIVGRAQSLARQLGLDPDKVDCLPGCYKGRCPIELSYRGPEVSALLREDKHEERVLRTLEGHAQVDRFMNRLEKWDRLRGQAS